jgi:hypothetical protein
VDAATIAGGRRKMDEPDRLCRRSAARTDDYDALFWRIMIELTSGGVTARGDG